MLSRAALGNTGIAVSKICFGTLTMGPLQSNLSPQKGGELIALAARQGVNFFDTAQLYQTYAHLREGMRLSGQPDLVVSTKTYAHTRELAMQAVEQARLELDRDYIDIFMLHEQESIHTLRGHAPALAYLLECKQKGIIKAVGASMHHIAAVYGAVQTGLDVIHPLLNRQGLGIADGSASEMLTAIRAAHKAGIGVFSMKPLGGGNLFKTAPACLDYVLALDCIDSVAIGMQSAKELEANINYFSSGCFTHEQAKYLSEKTRALHIDDWCEGCGKCVPACAANALDITRGRAVCDRAKCLLCGYCAARCPVFAIKIL